MIKTTMLMIVPKNNEGAPTCWCFAVEERELAKQILRERYPYGTHKIIETECEEFESAEEFESWAFEHSWD